jgi:hypothetical protein
MNANTFLTEAKVSTKPFFLTNESVSLKADLVLGSPKSGCSGVGICHISVSVDKSEFPCPAYPTHLFRTCKGGLAVAFSEQRLPEAVLLEHFSGGVFRVTDRFIMPKSLAGTLGLKNRVIHPGAYKVSRKLSFLIVEFD